MLRRRHFAQDETAGKAEKRQKAYEAHRQNRHPPGSLPGRAGTRRLVTLWFQRLPNLLKPTSVTIPSLDVFDELPISSKT